MEDLFLIKISDKSIKDYGMQGYDVSFLTYHIMNYIDKDLELPKYFSFIEPLPINHVFNEGDGYQERLYLAKSKNKIKDVIKEINDKAKERKKVVNVYSIEKLVLNMEQPSFDGEKIQ